MKISLSISDESLEEVTKFLTKKGIEIDDDAEFILLQKDKYPGHITARNSDGERNVISVSDIVTIESYGHTVEIHTTDKVFTTTERLYQLEKTLDPHKFLRVSNSVIISSSQIKEISPTFSMKFTLKMKNGSRVDVTRSYYSKFKEFFGI